MSDNPKILIADDEQECIDFVVNTFAETDYEIICASDGEEALSLAQQEKPNLIVLDVQMPKMSGFEVFHKLRSDAQFADTPIVMLTGIGSRTGVKIDGQDMGDYLGTEPDAYIDKPIEPIILKQTVNKLLKK